MKPIKRSKLRITLGKYYYTYKRYLKWYFGNVKYAQLQSEERLPFSIFKHQSPTLRKLKDVDMWLQYNKVQNLKLAMAKINGIVINPGETFSFWKLVGKPTKKKGYVDGMVLFYGTFKPGVGGGLCQLTNLIYWMTLHTPLTVIERYRHSYDVFPDVKRKLPFGSGATISYNYLDLMIRNDTNQPYQLYLYLENDDLVGEWRTTTQPVTSFEVYEKEHKITHEYWGGYIRHNLLFRRVLNNDGEQIDDEYVTENHAIMMYQPFLEAN